ncbi:MAG: glucose-6-phosphate dehydrogenase [Thermoguttaceae bacterium]
MSTVFASTRTDSLFSAEPAISPVAPKPLVQPAVLVIFGATGDLTARKLLPALFGLDQGGYLPAELVILGIGRRTKNDDQFRDDVRQALTKFRPDAAAQADVVQRFIARLFYHCTDFGKLEGMLGLRQRIEDLEQQRRLPGNRLFYLATDPDFFAPVIDSLANAGMVSEPNGDAWKRVVIEKPFGRDLTTARGLNVHILKHLREHQIYRIDHYLGKETVQNLLAFRFGNAIFEPLLNRQFVDHIQITAAETVGMEGRRGAFYDRAGALRDLVQNHLLQILALVAMEPPATVQSRDISDAKLKVLRQLPEWIDSQVARHVVRAQYGVGTVDGRPAVAYRQEVGVASDSITETYVAIRATVENWRWSGVPFLLRTGKCLARRVTEVAVHFKQPPLSLFRTVECEGDVCDLAAARPNVISFLIQPNEGIHLTFSTKRPGMNLDLQAVQMDFEYGHSFNKSLPEAYERLLLDALRGDRTLFMNADEVEAAWEFATPILTAWEHAGNQGPATYTAGSWGPREADRLTDGCCAPWRQP